jgi:hypothetical protein
MLSGTGYPSGENYPAGTGMELFFTRMRVRVTRLVKFCGCGYPGTGGHYPSIRTRCHLEVYSVQYYAVVLRIVLVPSGRGGQIIAVVLWRAWTSLQAREPTRVSQFSWP